MAKILAVVIILFIIILGCGLMAGPGWKPGPKKEYERLVAKFGKPNYTNKGPKGVAVWKSVGPFERVMIIDENVPHGAHCDYVYFTIKYFIDSKQIPAVLKVSDSVMYDKLKEELTVRCGSIENSIATLVLVDKVNNSLVPDDKVRETYNKMILTATDVVEENYRILESVVDDYELKHVDYTQCL
jgi:hypothetical protein